MDSLYTASYDFILPQELIAKYPIYPASDARLLVYNRSKDTIIHTTFAHIGDFLDTHTFVLNNTKVIKARLFGKKESGAAVEIFLLKSLPNNNFCVFIRGRVKVGDVIILENNVEAKVIGLEDDGSRVVRFFERGILVDFSQLLVILDCIGHVPLPPYIDRIDEPGDVRDYQTLFAKYEGSVASPTASLHFTQELLESIEAKFGIHFITLHVGAGTFKPVESAMINEHKMHTEYFNIEPNTCELIDSNKKIIAVGTTVTRTIESYIRNHKQQGECDLFLHPHNQPRRVDALVTNFHLPKSTLIMLVASFVGIDKTLHLYREAIKHKYRFYSYGDAMLIL